MAIRAIVFDLDDTLLASDRARMRRLRLRLGVRQTGRSCRTPEGVTRVRSPRDLVGAIDALAAGF